MILAQLRKDVDSVFAEDPERLNHIYGVRATAVILAHQQGVSMENAEVAAFLHDLTKNYTEEEHKALIEKYYDDVLNDYNEAIWHSFSAAAIARETYKVRNDDIIKAVESHTLGRPDMTTLEKILFVADYIEPNRPYANSKEVFKIAFKDLDRAVYRALERSIELFESKGETIPDVAYQARDFYKDAVEEKHGEN
ncbi:MAG: bis(5'-nucleosyl)-tetraphosphatase (symmetrical) YqeK [Candidatus Izemoplasmataceae bacterium]